MLSFTMCDSSPNSVTHLPFLNILEALYHFLPLYILSSQLFWQHLSTHSAANIYCSRESPAQLSLSHLIQPFSDSPTFYHPVFASMIGRLKECVHFTLVKSSGLRWYGNDLADPFLDSNVARTSIVNIDAHRQFTGCIIVGSEGEYCIYVYQLGHTRGVSGSVWLLGVPDTTK